MTESTYRQWLAELKQELYYEKNKQRLRNYQKAYYYSHREAQLASAKRNQRARVAKVYLEREGAHAV